MDDEILKTVESMLGKNVKVVDCEKTSTTREEEVLLINGIPITLEGNDSVAIKNALITGEIPSCDLLNQLLFRAGILKQPVHLETSLSVKSTMVTKEEVTVARGGKILDEKSTETKEDTFYTSSCKEIWEPIKIVSCVPAVQQSPEIPVSLPPSDHQQSGAIGGIANNSCDLITISSSSPINYSLLSSPPNSATSISDSSNYDGPSFDGPNYDAPNYNRSLNAIDNDKHKQQRQQTTIVSCDSGHDEDLQLSNSFDHSQPLIETPNSISSCLELSLDEADFIRNPDDSTGGESRTVVFTKMKPQQLILPPTNLFTKKKGKSTDTESNTESTYPSTDLTTRNCHNDFDENILVYRDSNLVSGSLNALIQHMIPTSNYYPDKSFLFAFLLSARLFIRPFDLLQKLWQISQDQQDNVTTTTTNDSTALIQFANRFIQVIQEWIDTFPYDFRDERMMHCAKLISRKCVHLDKKLDSRVTEMLENLHQILDDLDRYEKFLERINYQNYDSEIRSNVIGGSLSSSSSGSYQQQQQQQQLSIGTCTDITELCTAPSQLAQQLTHIELERLSHIGPEEFVQAFVKDNPQTVDTLSSDIKKTRNLESYVQWFNRLSYLVATEIVKHSKKKQRVRIIEYWIETARECFNIGNFNSLMSIIAGLNMSPISRLRKTWSKVQSAKFLVLEHQMDPSSNFNSYRSTLKAAMWRSAGATDERERIVIPFFSLLVKDLYFLNEGCSNRLPNGHINFEKFWQLAKQVTEFIAWKRVTCPFQKLDKIIMFLQTNYVFNENQLALVSFECEQPENNQEKDRFKLLKMEQQQNSSMEKLSSKGCDN